MKILYLKNSFLRGSYSSVEKSFDIDFRVLEIGCTRHFVRAICAEILLGDNLQGTARLSFLIKMNFFSKKGANFSE